MRIVILLIATMLLSGEVLSETEIHPSLQLPDYPPLEAFSEISERPLFVSTRRPKAEPSVVSSSNASELKKTWRLVGVILKAEEPLAMFSEQAGAKRLKLSIGMELDRQWVVHEVGTDYAVVESNGDEARFELWKPRERTAPASVRDRTSTLGRSDNPQSPSDANHQTDTSGQGRTVRSAPERTQ